MENQDQLVGKQMRRWEVDKRLRHRFERDAVEGEMAAPVITVSRQWGSGGTNIANLVAKELDYRLYDKEIIDHVATLSGADPAQIREHDERGHDVVSSLVLQLLEGKRPTETVYLRALVRVLRQIAAQGKAVIVGRAGTCILPDSLRVRIVAPEPLRVARIAELHDMDEKTARRAVLDMDRQRGHFIRGHFGCDPRDVLGYDLVINTEHFTIEQAAQLIISAVRDRQQGSGV